jgi:hypothetical protein
MCNGNLEQMPRCRRKEVTQMNMRWEGGTRGDEEHTWQCGMYPKLKTCLVDGQSKSQVCSCECDRFLEVDRSLDVDEVDVPKDSSDGFFFQRCADELWRRNRGQRGVLWVQDSEGINNCESQIYGAVTVHSSKWRSTLLTMISRLPDGVAFLGQDVMHLKQA